MSGHFQMNLCSARTKRKRQQGDGSFCPQMKVQVHQSLVDAQSEAAMQQVYQRTQRKLFEGVRQLPSKRLGDGSKEDGTRLDGSQLQILQDGSLVQGATRVAKPLLRCQCAEVKTERCFFCDIELCTQCSRLCDECQHVFCSSCSILGYGDSYLVRCLDCTQ